MFETLKGKLQTVFDGLAKRGALSEADVDAALREVRMALLDADVALPVVKSFIEKLRNAFDHEAARLKKFSATCDSASALSSTEISAPSLNI